LFNPGIILSRIFTKVNLEYIILLVAPVIWGLSPNHLTPLVAALPALGLNLLTDYQPQKDLVHQYSLPILPFLLLSVIASLAAGKGWLRRPKIIIIWSLIWFLILTKYTYFGSKYLEQLDTLSAMREAVTLVPEQAKLLTSPQIAPHLTHRSLIKLAIKEAEPINIESFDSILLNRRYPSWENSEDLVIKLVDELQKSSKYKLIYQKNDVFLFNIKSVN
jgi:uncharacterized membrane protein